MSSPPEPRLLPEQRAATPRPPARTPALDRARDEHDRYLRDREALEHRSLLRGLILLAVAVLLVSIARAGLDRVFVPGWWRQW